MLRLAHLSDLHLNGHLRRREIFRRELIRAHQWKADRLVLTGDLTADGKRSQFDEVGKVLQESGWSPFRTHLVFGNHDGTSAKQEARSTSLYPYADAADTTLLPGVVIAGIDTTFPNRAPIFNAMGRVLEQDVRNLELSCIPRTRCVIGVMHHGPQGHPLEFFEGLIGRERVLRAIEQNPNLHIMCGHDHRAMDRGKVRVAGSVAYHPDPLRIYDVIGPHLLSIYKSEIPGSWMSGMLP